MVAVWFKNPLEYFARYPEVDVLATTDVRRPTNNDDGLEAPQACGMADMNIGEGHGLSGLQDSMWLSFIKHYCMLAGWLVFKQVRRRPWAAV